LIGLKRPNAGTILFSGTDFWASPEPIQQSILRQSGILFQTGALWSNMTLEENIALLLREFTNYTREELRELCALKLSLVGLNGFGEFYPAEISGGMRKRAALARAMALDPKLFFLDEPSAGLDPISARRLDDLILELRDSLNATFVVITHELASIFAIGTDSIFLDNQALTITAAGNPKDLLEHSDNAAVRRFLTRSPEG
jgi:phospholipid/cholesterol/gamma-HCH transport system ATP-binding protein